MAPWVNWLRTGPGAAELRERIKTGGQAVASLSTVYCNEPRGHGRGESLCRKTKRVTLLAEPS